MVVARRGGRLMGAAGVDNVFAGRRWRWLLVGGGLGGVAAAWVVGLAEAVVVVAGVRLLVGGVVGYRHSGAVAAAQGGMLRVHEEALGAGSQFLAGVVVCALAAVLSVLGWLALRDLGRRRPWLLVAWQTVFHSRRCRFDSAGFAAEVYAAAGHRLGGGADWSGPAAVYRSTVDYRVALADCRAGDLVFWADGPPSDENPEEISHVAVHLGGDQVAHAGGAAGGVAVERTDRALIAPDGWPAGRPYAITRPPVGVASVPAAGRGSGELAVAGSAPGGLRL